MSKEINLEQIETKERLNKVVDRMTALETEMAALKRETDWKRQFTAVALPIMVTILIAVFTAVSSQNGRFEDVNRRIDDTNQQIRDSKQDLSQQIQEVKQEVAGLKQQLNDLETLIRQTQR